jgi:hypothetical protein
MFLTMVDYVFIYVSIWQPEVNYKKVRGEGAKFKFVEHPEDMRPPPFL